MKAQVISARDRSNSGRVVLWAIACLTAVLILSEQSFAQSAPSAMLQQFQAVRNQWFAAVVGAANNLFALLALVEFAWSAALLVLEKSDLQGFTAGVVRRLMFIGGFYTLLQFGPIWIPTIIDSFEMIGQRAANSGPLAPSAVFARGLDIAGNLFHAASQAGFFENMGTALALVLAAILAFLAFVGITIQFIVAMVESYIVVGAGFIFLGFGGSRWTASYVERYIALAVSVGVKILVLYLLIAAGMQVSADWANDASLVAAQQDPAMSAWDIAGGALIFLVLCWQAPKLTSGILGGAPTLSGGDMLTMGGVVTVGGLAVAGAAGTGVAMAARLVAAKGASMAVGQTVGAAASGGSAASAVGGDGSSVPPPSRSGGGSGSGGGTGGSLLRNAGTAASLGGSATSVSGVGAGNSGGHAAPSSKNLKTSSSGGSDSAHEPAPVAPPPPDSRAANRSVQSTDLSQLNPPPINVATPGSIQDAGGSLARGQSTGSRVGTAMARLGHSIAGIASWSSRGFRRTAAVTRRARYIVPHDAPPPPPPPPPMKTTDQSE